MDHDQWPINWSQIYNCRNFELVWCFTMVEDFTRAVTYFKPIFFLCLAAKSFSSHIYDLRFRVWWATNFGHNYLKWKYIGRAFLSASDMHGSCYGHHPVVDVIQLFWRQSKFLQNWEIEYSLLWCLIFCKTIYSISKTGHKNT